MDEFLTFLQENWNRREFWRARRFVNERAGSGRCFGTELLIDMLLSALASKFSSRVITSFDELSAQIAALLPEGRWQSSAAQAYLAQSLAKSRRAKMLADLDHQTAGLVSAQAKAVQIARRVLIICMVFVSWLLMICLKIDVSDGLTGPILLYQIALTECTLAMSAVDVCLMWVVVTTLQDASKVQALIQRLTNIVMALRTLSEMIPGLHDVPLTHQIPLPSSMALTTSRPLVSRAGPTTPSTSPRHMTFPWRRRPTRCAGIHRARPAEPGFARFRHIRPARPRRGRDAQLGPLPPCRPSQNGAATCTTAPSALLSIPTTALATASAPRRARRNVQGASL